MAKGKKRQRLLIVDGFNVLRSGSRYQEAFAHPDYTDDAFNTARERLINDVINFAGREYKAVIVFDGGDNQFSTGEVETIGGVRIMFSPAGTSAEKVIEKLAHDARVRNVETMVVTSDATIQDTVFGGLQLAVLGVIGEYLGRDYIENKRRPIYLAKERLDSTKG